MSRRQFLVGGAALAATAYVAGCSPRRSRRELSAVLGAMAERTGARVIGADSPGYAMARLPWNARYDDVLPAAIVKTQSPAAVAGAVGVAREFGVDFRIRSGRHSFAGFSTTDGIIIDTSTLNQIELSADQHTVTVGAGASNLAVYQRLSPRDVTFAGGTCPTVGVAGLALGGGIGRMSQAYGVTSDTVRAMSVVLADGTEAEASPDQNPDLFWALRGGAGGNFAAVTSLTFDVFPTEARYTTWTLTFAWAAAAELMMAWQEWLLLLPRNCHTELTFGNGVDAPVVTVTLIYAGRRRDGSAWLGELLAEVGVRPTSRSRESGGFFFSEREAYCHGLSIEECNYQQLSDEGRLPRGAMTANSDFVDAAWPREAIDVTIDFIDRRQRDPLLTPAAMNPALQMGKWLMESTGGAVNEPSPSATAFSHRNSRYVATYQARWLADAAPEQVAANLEWLAEWYAAVEPWRSGSAYQNYPNPHQDDWLTAYYGSNVERLQLVKRSYDPDDVFRFPQSIPV